MSETTPDPADVHTGTDRVELTDAEKWLIPHLTQLDAAADARDVYAAVESIVAARVQALTAQRDRLCVDTNINADEVERQRRLLDLARAELAAANARCAELEAKSEAFRGLSESWHRMYEGAEALNADIRQRALALADQWDRDLGKAFNPHGDELRAALTPEGSE